MGHKYVRNFITSSLLMAAFAAEAQEQKVLETNSDNDPKTTMVIGANDTPALSLEKDKTCFYNDLTPYFTARTENKHGDYAEVSGLELLILNDEKFSAITAKFMVELGKQLGDGTTLVFKAGRSPSEGNLVFDNALNYYSDAYNSGMFGNPTERIVFGYTKNDNFIELGIIGNSGEGFYVIPNPKQSSFWAKSGLTLLQKSGITLSMTGATRLGSGAKELLASLRLQTPSGFGTLIMGNHDFNNHQTNLCARAWQDFICG
jgi:hypothetical protein